MGRVGACADSAAMEFFFSLLRKNALNRMRWNSREELRLAILTWIETTHHLVLEYQFHPNATTASTLRTHLACSRHRRDGHSMQKCRMPDPAN
jgi:hypothetical protein